MRLTEILVLAGLALAVSTSSAAAARPARAPILGVVPHTSHGGLAPSPLRFSNPTSSAIRAAGPTTLTFNASYQNLINQYFTDVAHDSGTGGNVYSVATQYSDGTGAIQYQSTFGGAIVAHDPLPANGCDDGFDAYCLTDQQLETEIQAVLTAHNLHGSPSNMFFLLTPNGVGSCFDAFGQCSTDTFCAYHSYFTNSSNEKVIYANEPYLGPYPGCTGPAQGFPNDTDADTTINTISHEHNEAITDPLTDPANEAWIAADGSENGDLCAYGFGSQTNPGVNAYNQVINGHHYDLQQEYSNAAPVGCSQHIGGVASAPTFGSGPLVYHGGPVMHTNTTYAIYWLPTARNTSAPVVGGVSGTPIANTTLLSTTTGSWAVGGAPFAYQWQRCSNTGTNCVDIPGATAATYQVTSSDGGHVVRSTVSATNVNGASPFAPSAGTATVIDIPGVTTAPKISGKTKVGKKLTGSHGTWTYPATFGYQWLRCNAAGGSCANIGHATKSTYKLTKRDAGHKLRLRVTATNAAGSLAATSAASARVKH